MISSLLFRKSENLETFLHLKTKFYCSYFCNIFYKFECGGCNATYYGKTKRHFKVRMCEQSGISALSGKLDKGDDDSAIK